MSTDFFSTIPLELFTPNKKVGVANLYDLLRRANAHAKKNMHIEIHPHNETHVSLPKKTENKYFPLEMQNYIVLHAKAQQSIVFKIGKRSVKINFVFMNTKDKFDIKKYIKPMGLLFALMDMLTGKNTNINKTLEVNVYLTPFKKEMPLYGEEFTSKHVNSALTYICNENGQITIYREEEWFKVLIHECIHSYCLDFSGQDQKLLGKCLFNYFPIHVEGILLSETYAETWGEILNCGIISFTEANSPLRVFSLYFNFYMQVEIVHSIFQANKILERYQCSYNNLREKRIIWGQKTHVYEYHVLKSILLFSFDKFIVWCFKNNGKNLIPFAKTNLYLFCDLIKDSYHNKEFQEKVRRIKTRNNGNGLRMSINEL